MSLCRALICNTKIILFDEVTAGIDPDSDNKIQSTLKNKFNECTIFTIAHRLETIQYCNLIIILANGKISKIGTLDEVNLNEISSKDTI